MDSFDARASLETVLSSMDELILPAAIADEWEPIECLGHNAHSETLLLRSRKDGERAVLKTLTGKKPEPELADSIRKLSHPGLPRILAVICETDRFCILREYIEGDALSGAALPVEEEKTVRYALQLCRTLEYLHSLTPPMIHRDVKPENIILRPDGTVILIDFGIARLYSEKAENDTRVMGTERFAPPEQYGFAQTDCRSDLYALGVVMGWLLTGSARREEFIREIRDKGLRRIVEKATAFAPEDRYASAAELKKALENRSRPKRKRLWAVGMIGLLILCCIGFAIGKSRPKAIVFAEPVIERAVRTVLGKAEDAVLTAEDLSAVEGLYIFADAVAADQNGFYEAAGNWYASGTRARGGVMSLEDVRQLPNLRDVMIGAEQLTDLSPLSGLTELEKVEFKHNSIRDISPLGGMEKLASVGLNDNPMTDVSALLTLPNLRFLDLCDASSYDAAFMDRLGDLEFLNISNRTESWKRLGVRRVRDLRLGWTGMDSLNALSGVSGLEHLEIEHTGITSLEGIGQHAELVYLRVSGNAIRDLSPVLELPKLEILVINEEMREAAEKLGKTSFEIRYE